MVSKVEEIKYDSVEFEGIAIAYSWCRSRRRTLGITVRKDKSVSVRVPLRTATKEVRAFVTNRVEWVLKVWKKLDKRQTPQQQQQYMRGAVIMFKGEAYRLEFTKGPQRSLQLHDDLLILTFPEIPSEDTVRKMITHWYRTQAVEIMKTSWTCTIVCVNAEIR
jgi:predicted metal-dependent hydrolase